MLGSIVPLSLPTCINTMLSLHLQRHIISSLEPRHDASCCEQVYADLCGANLRPLICQGAAIDGGGTHTCSGYAGQTMCIR